ncbi:hypothetical protein [Paracoccus sp. DMF-8]|uniref:hypothetical protein n=1 Tax=Paracoccus sp. DMF-8 TaxID=3019445 RepID=UPI003204ED8B
MHPRLDHVGLFLFAGRAVRIGGENGGAFGQLDQAVLPVDQLRQQGRDIGHGAGRVLGQAGGQTVLTIGQPGQRGAHIRTMGQMAGQLFLPLDQTGQKRRGIGHDGFAAVVQQGVGQPLLPFDQARQQGRGIDDFGRRVAPVPQQRFRQLFLPLGHAQKGLPRHLGHLSGRTTLFQKLRRQTVDALRHGADAGLGCLGLAGAGCVALQVIFMQIGHLARDLIQKARDRMAVQRLATPLAQIDAGEAAHPFFQFAVKAVLAMGGEQFQQADDQRPGQTQQGTGKGRAHAAKLAFQPLHQLVENLQPAFAFLRLQAPDGFDHRRNGDGKAIERPQKSKENQQVRHIARDIARFVDPGRDRFEDRARRGGRDRAIPARAEQRGQRQPARGARPPPRHRAAHPGRARPRCGGGWRNARSS